MTDPKPPRVFPTKPPRHRVEKHIRENVGKGHSRQIDTDDQESDANVGKFNGKQLYGMTRRQVMVTHNAVMVKVPEIVGHIIKNLNKNDWLISLLSRYGLNFTDEEIFSSSRLKYWANEKAKTYLDSAYVAEKMEKEKTDLLKKILLRLAGLLVKDIRVFTDGPTGTPFVDNMFGCVSDKILEKFKESDRLRKSK